MKFSFVISILIIMLNVILYAFDFRYSSKIIGDLMTLEVAVFALSLTLGGLLASMPKSILIIRIVESGLLKDILNTVRISIVFSLVSIAMSLFSFSIPDTNRLSSVLLFINMNIVITHVLVFGITSIATINIIYINNFCNEP